MIGCNCHKYLSNMIGSMGLTNIKVLLITSCLALWALVIALGQNPHSQKSPLDLYISSYKSFICIGGAFWVLEMFMVALMEVGLCHYQYSTPLNQLSNKVKNNCIKTFWMKQIIFHKINFRENLWWLKW